MPNTAPRILWNKVRQSGSRPGRETETQMESEQLSALNLNAWQAREGWEDGTGGWRQSGNGNGSVGKETKQKLRKWQVRVRQSPARIYLSELCQLLSVSQVSSSSIDSTACHFACRSVANDYCISIKSLPRSSSLLCHLRVRHLLLHREKNCGFLYPLLLWLAVLLFFFELVAKLVVNLRALKLFFLHLTSIKEVIGN